MADLQRAEEAEYVRQLEDAVNALWGWMGPEQVKELREDCPRLVEFLRHLHHQIDHVEAMVRVNVWTER